MKNPLETSEPCKTNTLEANSTRTKIFFRVFTKNLSRLHPFPTETNLPSNRNISKIMRVLLCSLDRFLKTIPKYFNDKLMYFALLVLQLLIFKSYRIIGISKSVFFNFSSTERVKQNHKVWKSHSKLPKLPKLFSSNSRKSRNSYCLFTGNLTLLFPITVSGCPNVDLPWNSNI